MVNNLRKGLSAGASWATRVGILGTRTALGAGVGGLANATVFRNEGDSFGGSFFRGAALGAGLGAGFGVAKNYMKWKSGLRSNRPMLPVPSRLALPPRRGEIIDV